MIKKRAKTIILIIVAISLLSWLSLAAIGDGIKIVSPINGANVTSIQGILFNATYNNLTDIINPQNATFYLNISGTWQAIGGTSGANGCTLAEMQGSCSANITNTTIPDGVYGVNVTIYNGSSSATLTHIINGTSIFYIDSTPPSSNVTAPLSTANYSQTITITANVTDATIGVNTVVFNITNSGGAQVSTVNATKQGNVYSAVFNTAVLSEGYYNISAIATDLLGNINNTARTPRILFDNTVPTVAHSCDDLTVTVEDTITCT